MTYKKLTDGDDWWECSWRAVIPLYNNGFSVLTDPKQPEKGLNFVETEELIDKFVKLEYPIPDEVAYGIKTDNIRTIIRNFEQIKDFARKGKQPDYVNQTEDDLDIALELIKQNPDSDVGRQ